MEAVEEAEAPTAAVAVEGREEGATDISGPAAALLNTSSQK
jgi:hypothetical protein